MWLFDTTLYQIYPLGMLECPFEAPAIEDESGIAAQSELHRVCKLADWAPYLQELGVGAILLNPVLASDTHGYNTRGFFHIDCRLGTNEDFAQTVATLHAHGIRVILDAVFNHVGRGFWAFRDVQDKRWDSPYKDWFNISFDGDTHFGDGFWYEGWEGNQDLVKLNLQNPAVVDHLLEAVRFWKHDLGVDGLRLDVAYSLDRAFMHRLRELADELGREPHADGTPDDGFPLIGEVLHGDYNLIVNDEILHSCTNYECYKGLYSSFNSMNMFEIAHSLHRQFGGDPWCIYQGKHLVSFADNHDVTRLASILTEPRHLQPAYALLFGMPGIPCLYYGSEWGQLGEKGAGYEADLALRPALDAPNADALHSPAAGYAGGTDPNELTAFVHELACVRQNSRALCHGSYRNVVITNKQLLFERVAPACDGAPEERVLVAINAEDAPFTFHDGSLNGTFEALFASQSSQDAPVAESISLEGSLDIPPYGVLYLRVR
ncbi:alpha-amylase family glycosyl hydrolase [Collinsella provencensis]|uniref:alpha-amylase family glycosyl hydrolase n=1 Tax=Collinsella provencensis TaxID=1937461 RepID=UPI000C82B200|nr:alpha-amylase family glycosyl hydrolase [Collinsella provencensis]